MTQLHIGLDTFVPPGAAVTAASFPNLSFAVQKIAQRGQEIWQEYAAGRPLPNGKVIRARSGAYMRSIQMRMLGDFSAEDFSELPYADSLENGTQPYDMKKMLNTSLKTRVSKKGKRYLVIPFRHGTPGSTSFASVMPTAVHELWQGMRTSKVTSVYKAPNELGVHDARSRKLMTVTRRGYQWGDRMTAPQLRTVGARGKQLRNMAGMVHMQNPGGGHGQYLTFRVMTEDSKGWITKGTEAMKPAEATANQLRSVAEDAFRAAVTRDIKSMMGAA